MSKGENRGNSNFYIQFTRLTPICQCASLKSQINYMNSKLQDYESQRDTYHAALIAAEARADRLKSSTVLAMQARVPTEQSEAIVKETEESQRMPPSPAVSGLVDWCAF